MEKKANGTEREASVAFSGVRRAFLRSPIAAWRIAFVIAISMAASVSLIFLFITEGISAQVASIVGSIAQTALERHEGLGCLRKPDDWGLTTPLGARIYAYDIRTLRSANPRAPSLVSSLRKELARLRERTHGQLSSFASPTLLRRRSLLLHRGGVYFYRLAEKGPCSLLMVRPLLQRIEEVAALARKVGEQKAVWSFSGPPLDELGLIHESLEQKVSAVPLRGGAGKRTKCRAGVESRRLFVPALLKCLEKVTLFFEAHAPCVSNATTHNIHKRRMV